MNQTICEHCGHPRHPNDFCKIMSHPTTAQDQKCFCFNDVERTMDDDELLEKTITLAQEQHHALMTMHQRHGHMLEDICCRVVSNMDTTKILAEIERREILPE